jgi:hypothetical protein
MAYSIKIQNGSSDIVDINIDDPDVIKRLVGVCKDLNKAQRALTGMAMFAGMDDEDVENIFVSGLEALVNTVKNHTPRPLATAPAANQGRVAPAPAPAARVAPAPATPAPAVVAPAPVGATAVGVPSAFAPTPAPAGKRGGILRRGKP